MKRIIAVGGAALAGVGIALVIALNSGGPTEPGPSGAEIFEQGASAQANGVSIAAEWATYSGTETVLGLRITGDGPAEVVEVPGSAISSASAHGRAPVTSRLDAEGGWAVELSPLAKAGRWQLTIDYVFVLDAGKTTKIDGQWTLGLDGPSAQRFDDVMRIERFASEALTLLDEQVTISGLRSTTRTIFRYAPPAGWRELSPPILELPDGQTALPRATGNEGPVRVAEFNPTEFGSDVRLRLGSFALEGGEGTIVKLQLGDVLARAGVTRDERGEAPVLADDVIEGPAEIVQSIELGRHERSTVSAGRPIYDAAPPPGPYDTVSIVLRGSWHPQDDPGGDPLLSTPGLIDANGKRLWQTRVGTGYSKAPDGTIREGQSDATFYLPPDANLATVTVVLGPPSSVVAGDWVATLSPI